MADQATIHGLLDKADAADVTAVETQAALDAAVALILADPRVAQDLNEKKLPPVMRGAAYKHTPLVLALLRAYPSAASSEYTGWANAMPLHQAIRSGASAEVIDALLELNPAAWRHVAANGWTSLHFAGMGVDVLSVPMLERLVSDWPEAVNIQDRWQQTPMKFAADHPKCTLEKFQVFYKAAPDAIRVVDSWGATVLHKVAYNGELDLVRFVHQANPAAITVRDNEGRLPVQCAIVSKTSHSPSARYLLETMLTPELATVPKGGALPPSDAVQAWLVLLRDGQDRHTDVVESLLDQFAEHVEALAKVKDEYGRRALELATAQARVAIIKRLYLLGRYCVQDGPPEHASRTSMVYRALDYLGNGPGAAAVPIILKFMVNREEYMREIHMRELVSSGAATAAATDFIVPAIRHHHEETDPGFTAALAGHAYASYPHLIVFEAGDRSLHSVLDAERYAPRWRDECVRATRQITEALAFLHSRGIMHGDLKPRNVMRVQAHYKLIDMDAAAALVDGYAGAKLSTGYSPPELLRAHFTGGAERLPASTAVDMWGLGVTLYQMLRGATLLHVDASDSAVVEEDLRGMAAWTDDRKAAAIAAVPDLAARHLLSMLLYADPARRPCAARVLQHPFLTGKPAVRLAGQEAPAFDVFISYRVSSDAATAEAVYHALTAAGVRVWWDRVCLPDGLAWMDGFCDGLANARVFLPIISPDAISHSSNARCNWALLQHDSACDNVLLEHRLALELLERGLVEFVFPLFVGSPTESDALTGASASGAAATPAASGHGSQVHRSFFAASTVRPAAVAVRSVEEAVCTQLDRAGLGTPLVTEQTAATTWSRITAFQGMDLVGEFNGAINRAAAKVQTMLRPAEA